MTPVHDDDSCPEQVVPSQWFDRLVPNFFDVPERRLLLAVLCDAVRLMQGNPKHRAEVLGWIRGQPARITFQALCDELGIEAHELAVRLNATPDTAHARPRRIRANMPRRIKAQRDKATKARCALAASTVQRPPVGSDEVGWAEDALKTPHCL